jgi:hypothetical protein
MTPGRKTSRIYPQKPLSHYSGVPELLTVFTSTVQRHQCTNMMKHSMK